LILVKIEGWMQVSACCERFHTGHGVVMHDSGCCSTPAQFARRSDQQQDSQGINGARKLT
jgi:hypothetical protein